MHLIETHWAEEMLWGFKASLEPLALVRKKSLFCPDPDLPPVLWLFLYYIHSVFPSFLSSPFLSFSLSFLLPSFFLSLATYGSVWARDGIQAAVPAMPDPLPPCTGWGLNPCLQGDLSHCSWIFNPLCHSRNCPFFFSSPLFLFLSRL